MNRTEIIEKALQYYCKDIAQGLPYKWTSTAFKEMATTKQDDSTERLKDLINYVIDLIEVNEE